MNAKFSNKSNIYRLLTLPHQKPLQYRPSPLKRSCKAEIGKMRGRQLTLGHKLTTKQELQREKLVISLIETGKRMLDLKTKTIELAIRIFDYYTFLLSQGYYFDSKTVQQSVGGGKMLLDDKQARHLALIACLFSCAKYEEIYPPGLSDFIYYLGGSFTKQQVIRKEIDILRLTNFSFIISTASQWYEYYFDEAFPAWGIDCYCKFYCRAEDIARAVRETEREENVMKEVNLMQRNELMVKVCGKLLRFSSTPVRQSDEQTLEQ